MDFAIKTFQQISELVGKFCALVESGDENGALIAIDKEAFEEFRSTFENKAELMFHFLDSIDISRKAALKKKFVGTSEKLMPLLACFSEEELRQLGFHVPQSQPEPEDPDGDGGEISEPDVARGGRGGRGGRRVAGKSMPKDEAEAAEVPPENLERLMPGRYFSSRHPGLEVVEKTLPPKADHCPDCDGKLQVTEYVEKEMVEFVEARLRVVRFRQPKTRCVKCQKVVRPHVADISEPILIKNSPVSASFLHFLIDRKFCLHLTGYRLEGVLGDLGMPARRNQIAGWFIKAGDVLLPLYDLMMELLPTNPTVNMDETPLRVHKEEGRDDSKMSCLWVAVGRGVVPLAVFVYSQTKGSIFIETALGPDYRGSLQTDGNPSYAAYSNRHPGNVRLISCLAHVRRRFVAYLEGKGLLPGDVYTPQIVVCIRDIFRTHAVIAARSGLSPAHVVQLKHELVGPLLDRLETLLRGAKTIAPRGHKFAADVDYALSQLPGQRNYLDDPIAAPDNNICERVIKFLVIGRKNWLFADSPAGARTVAVISSLVASARLNGISPKEYIRHVLWNIQKADTREKLMALLPCNVNLPREARPALTKCLEA